MGERLVEVMAGAAVKGTAFYRPDVSDATAACDEWSGMTKCTNFCADEAAIHRLEKASVGQSESDPTRIGLFVAMNSNRPGPAGKRAVNRQVVKGFG
jgi:hypothetical protein